MIVRGQANIPDQKQDALKRAIRLQWAMVGFMISIILVLYFVLGASQAMKTAWFEDMLGLAPPIAFLVATHIERQGPTSAFPFGKYRAISIAFLVSSVALLAMGVYLIVDSGMKLIMQEHPTIGLIEIFGVKLWLGWLMIAALLYSVIPPVVIGRMTVPLSKELHDKSLLAGAKMAQADWMTGLAAVVGVIGIGFGLWWADAVAALVIAVDLLKDGVTNSWRALKDLADQHPTETDSNERDPIEGRISEVLEEEEWIDAYELQLREEGRFLTGVVFVSCDAATEPARRMARLADRIQKLDWRLYDIAVAPSRRMDHLATAQVG